MPPRRRPDRSPVLRTLRWALVALALLAAWWWWQPPHAVPQGPPAAPGGEAHGEREAATPRARGIRSAGTLPAEALDTLRRIRAGGPYRHRQDDGVFGNREGLLPDRPRGWYREYTVDTPGARDRGARRIVTGGRPPAEFYYTDDHYRSFRRIDVETAGSR